MILSGKTPITRREFISTSLLASAALSLGARTSSRPLMLIRYDAESRQPEEIRGVFEKMVSVHRKEGIPASFFCLGAAVEMRESQFQSFFDEVKDDPLFDIQDHSYSHVGLGYDHGISVNELRADFDRSFDVHERMRGERPIGVSMAGTGSRDGERLAGFDATEKTRAELDMLAGLGIRMINTFHSGVDGSKHFVSYRDLGHPEMMGFPSGYGGRTWRATSCQRSMSCGASSLPRRPPLMAALLLTEAPSTAGPGHPSAFSDPAPTRSMWRRRGPWAPSCMVCSISAVPERF